MSSPFKQLPSTPNQAGWQRAAQVVISFQTATDYPLCTAAFDPCSFVADVGLLDFVAVGDVDAEVVQGGGAFGELFVGGGDHVSLFNRQKKKQRPSDLPINLKLRNIGNSFGRRILQYNIFIKNENHQNRRSHQMPHRKIYLPKGF